MIKKIYFENFTTFNKKVVLDLEADSKTKKFPDNVTEDNLLKSAVIYGPNNTGKTQFLEGVEIIKDTLLNKHVSYLPNIFNPKKPCKFHIKFIIDKKDYSYEFWEVYNNQVIYEKFEELNKTIFLKDTINKKYSCPKDKKLEKMLENTSNNNILIYSLNVENFEILNYAKKILTYLANKIEIINMNNIPNSKTIELLKNNAKNKDKIVSFVKNADLYLDDYYYDLEDSIFDLENLKIADDKILKNQNLMDQIKMVSVYKGRKVPSIFFDSIGTRKIASLASYLIEALDEGKTLFVDELDSSLHFKLTRAIISLFNNSLNKNAQLISTVHDVSLLDCKNLFRKEQIWFTDKTDKDGSILYSLKDFSYHESGIRDTSDVIEKYSKGIMGAIPEPDLISVLLEDDDE